MSDYEDTLPTSRYENWICRYCSEGFHNLASLEGHLTYGGCQEQHFADRGKAPWRRYEDGVFADPLLDNDEPIS